MQLIILSCHPLETPRAAHGFTFALLSSFGGSPGERVSNTGPLVTAVVCAASAHVSVPPCMLVSLTLRSLIASVYIFFRLCGGATAPDDAPTSTKDLSFTPGSMVGCRGEIAVSAERPAFTLFGNARPTIQSFSFLTAHLTSWAERRADSAAAGRQRLVGGGKGGAGCRAGHRTSLGKLRRPWKDDALNCPISAFTHSPSPASDAFVERRQCWHLVLLGI